MHKRGNGGLLNGLTALLLFLPGLAMASYNDGNGGKAAAIASEVRDPAPGWDHLWNEMLIDITIIGVIFAAVCLYFMYKFRRRNPDDEGHQPKLTPAAAVAWVVIPVFLFMADDFYLAANGWDLWNKYRQVPEDRMEIKLESAMWTWDYTYPNGVKTYNDLIVPAGKPILLRMTSRDTLHSHFIPDFRVKEDSMPGRVTYLWFYPKEVGEHLVTCTEYCGHLHSRMYGKVTVLSKEDFNKWYEAESDLLKLAMNKGVM